MAVENKNLEQFFVPVEREQDYLEAHRIRVRQLDNGLTIISAWRSMDDAASVDIRTFFNTGAINDPADKLGSHHLLEHLVAGPNDGQKAAQLGAYFNGSTSWDSYTFTLNGISNPNVREYGIWPFLPEYTGNLKFPLDHHSNKEQATQTQREIILRELEERYSDQGMKKAIFRYQSLFASDNPIMIGLLKAGGTPEGLAPIKVPDLEEMSQKIFIPDKTMVLLLTQAPTRESNDLIMDQLSSEFGSFPNSVKKSMDVDKSKKSTLNPDFKPGNVYILPENSEKPTNHVQLYWLHQVEDYTLENASLNMLTNILDRQISEYVRNNGISYGGSLEIASYDEIKFGTIDFQIKNEDIENRLRSNIIPGIKEMIGDLTASQLSESLEAIALRNEAVPESTMSKIDTLVSSLKNHGRVFDLERYQSMLTGITVKDLQNWQEKIVAGDPAIFILN
jgi:predicted Zn-dependent peptidase